VDDYPTDFYVHLRTEHELDRHVGEAGWPSKFKYQKRRWLHLRGQLCSFFRSELPA